MQELVVCGVPFGAKVLDSEAGAHAAERPISRKELVDACLELKKLGVTSVQIYTFWNKLEPNERGVFEWEYYDEQVSVLREAGIKWVPFFLMGPRYAAPDWWLESPGHKGLYCLEHGKYNPCESIWNEAFLDEVDRVMHAFAEHYLPMNVIESFQPGICGDYGESEFPDIGNWPGFYHSHRGFWCGGEDAKADFRAWLKHTFGTVEAVNAAWNTRFPSLDDAEPFLPHAAPSRTAWFGLLEWYRGAMTSYTEKWITLCRKNFPETPIYLCAGGMEQPELATQFADQIKICAKYGCGVRVTNEGNKFYDNFHWTSIAETACAHYGAYIGLEPVGPITPGGVTNRVFGSAAYGNRQMFNYYGNLMGRDNKPAKGGENFKKYIPLLKETPAQPAVAMFWPADFTSFFASNPDDMNDVTSSGIPVAVRDAMTFLRRQVNTVPLNERLILDGALDRCPVLVSPLGVFTHAEVLRRIAQWVRDGGVLVTAGIPKDLELRDVPEFLEACGLRPDYEYCVGHHEAYLVPDCPYPGFAAFPTFHCKAAVSGLLDDAVPLAMSKENYGGIGAAVAVKSVTSAVDHPYGKGRVILWTGLVSFRDDPEAIFPDPGTFRALLGDVIDRYAHLPSLIPAEGEEARAIIDGKLMALTKDFEIREV